MFKRLLIENVEGLGDNEVSDFRLSNPSEVVGIETNEYKDTYRRVSIKGLIYAIRDSIKLATIMKGRGTIEEEEITH